MKKIMVLKHCSGSEVDAEGVTQAPTRFEPGEHTVGDELARGLIESGDAKDLEGSDHEGKSLGGAPENKAKSSTPGKRKGKG